MGITVWPATPGFAAEIGDVDLARELSADDVSAIKQAFWDYGVLIFPEQRLSEEQHLAFASYFGPLEQVVFLKMNVKLRLRPELADVSNLNSRNEIWREQGRKRMIAAGNRSGTPTARSSICRRAPRYCMRAKFLRWEAAPNMRICGRPTTPCQMRSGDRSKGWSRSIP